MSLSSHLDSKTSPVRAWFEENLPETQHIARETNRKVHGDASECPVPRIEQADGGLVGTAVDYLLRACLRTSSIQRTVASAAAERLAEKRGIGDKAIEVEREAVKGIEALRPDQRSLATDEWADLCIRCLVLARFEQYYRAGFRVPTRGDLSRAQTLDDFVELSLSTKTIRDLERLGRVAWEDHGDLRRARPLVLNPRFQLSSALGGADADLIAGHRLIDWKASAATRVVGRRELWQLIGYALADSTDQYGIREVGIAALRWRSTVSWRLTDLLEELAFGPPTKLRIIAGTLSHRDPHNLDKLRSGFSQLVAGL